MITMKKVGYYTLGLLLGGVLAVGADQASSARIPCSAYVGAPVQVINEVQFPISGSCPRATTYTAWMQITSSASDFGPFKIRTHNWTGFNKLTGSVSALGTPIRVARGWQAIITVVYHLPHQDLTRTAMSPTYAFKLK